MESPATIKYRHTCEVSRQERLSNGKFVTTTLYEGECNYQPSTTQTVSGNIVVSQPKLYLPQHDAIINAGDAVKVVLEKGRTITAEVGSVRDKSGNFINGTRLELTKAQQV